MRIGYFDCFSGASGDMIVGSMIDAGCSPEFLRAQLDLLGVADIRLRVESVERHGLRGTLVSFETGETDPPRRSLSDITRILQSSELDDSAAAKAEAIFRRLAAAEAKVHGIPVDEVHFHEVGAIDTICDVVASVVGLRELGIERLYSSKLLLGSGIIDSAHGKIPIPSPATQEIVKGFPVYRIDNGMEMTTPTAAAIITELAEYAAGYEMRVDGVGYGAGARMPQDRPNLLRLVIGEMIEEFEVDDVCVIETNIDDATPEEIGFLQTRLLTAGALDVFVTGVTMKKNRPGFLLTLISSRQLAADLGRLLLSESSTAGYRFRWEARRKLSRRQEEVETGYGPVRIKFLFGGDIHKFSPEYDDVVKAAAAAGVPFSEVYRAALLAAAKIEGDEK